MRQHDAGENVLYDREVMVNVLVRSHAEHIANVYEESVTGGVFA